MRALGGAGERARLASHAYAISPRSYTLPFDSFLYSSGRLISSVPHHGISSAPHLGSDSASRRASRRASVIKGGGGAAEVAATSEGVVAPSGGGDVAASGGDVVSPSEGSRHLDGVLPSPKQNKFTSPSFM